MNRILRRPMFRTGGSAEGITSGLDTTKLNASRPGYQGTGNPSDQRVIDPIEERFLKRRDLLQKYMSPRPTGISDLMVQFGLDLASRPPSGNILSTAAAAAKNPFSQYTARKEAYRTADDRLNAALLGDVMDLASQEEIARIKAEGEKGKGKQFEYKGKYEDYESLINQQRELEARKRQLEEENITTKDPETDQVIGGQYDEEIREINEQLEDNQKLQNLFQEKEQDQVRAAILKGISNGIFTFDDLIVYDETGVPPKSDESLAQGGRAGYQNAGAVMPAVASAPGNMDQGPRQDSPVQNLSYEELRARLPQSITNDIVTLIANSEQALTDFANIQTQQDVNAFNQKYEVNLQLPAEA